MKINKYIFFSLFLKMITESSIYSVKSSELNDEMLAIRRSKEKIGYGLGILAQFIWALNAIQLKTYQPNFPEAFSNNSLVFWRSLPIWILGYIICKYKNIKIKPEKEIKHKFWFYMRSAGNYLGIYLWIKVLSYFRVSTSQVIASFYPIIVIILSVIILHETFYFRYIIGIFICIISSAILLTNERKPEVKKTVENTNSVVGFFVALTYLTVNGFVNFSQKIICKDHLTPDEQNYYVGIYNTLPAFIFCCFELHFGFNSITYILYAISNGLIIFYLGNALSAKTLEYLAVSKYMPITYMCTFFIFLLGVTVLKEPLFFSDIVGALMIIGFQVYNIYYPPGRYVSDVKKEENNINGIESYAVIEKVDEKLMQ